MEVTTFIDNWYDFNKRDLPWRADPTPYHIWLSEIIMQQTRVNQGTQYYIRFLERFPTIKDLAAASTDEVLKIWQGLGYYTRARNMHETAKSVVNEMNGEFPKQYEALIELKGIGTYTAAAVASMAFNQPVALVDGNVYRLISRLFGISAPTDTKEGKKIFQKLADELLNHENPGKHNQAMMEFGALVCLPRNPACSTCILAEVCHAKRNGLTAVLPVKKNKVTPRVRYFNYLFAEHDGRILLKKRNGKDIWHSLWEFPLVETPEAESFGELSKRSAWGPLFNENQANLNEPVTTYQHKLTHQTLICSFFKVNIMELPDECQREFVSVGLQNVSSYAVPRVIDRYLKELLRQR